MFPTSALFGTCPVLSTCTNRGFPPCLFSHSKPVPPPLGSPAALVPQKRVPDTSGEPAAKRKAAAAVTVQKRTVELEKTQSDPAERTRLDPQPVMPAPTDRSSRVAGTSTRAVRELIDPTVNTGPPRLGIVKGAAHTPLVTRQKMLAAFHAQFVELYTPGILPTANRYSLASRHALAQEAAVYAKATKATYRNGCISVLARLKKRPPASRPDETGTMDDFDRHARERAEREQGRLTRARVQGFVHDRATLDKFGYLLEVPAGRGGDIPNEVGQKRECDRCKSEFVVKDDLTLTDRQACSYHYGKMTSEKIGGVKQRVWSCCPTLHATPCQVGPHVFKDEDPVDLHARVGFVTTESIARPSPDDREVQDLVALDCELLYTTAGMSLARVTVVDAAGELVYDAHVAPPRAAAVVDLNTRYSGVRAADLDRAGDTRLERVREELARWVGPDTVVVGHGVENDLRALRLIHSRVIDTAILFPHPNGGTWRYALRNLTKEYLKKFIQDSDPTIGHSAKDDAEAALELVRWKVLQKQRGKES
ncbi:hypothetical protein JCM11491_004786 [Sporobolomyces phaffii]